MAMTRQRRVGWSGALLIAYGTILAIHDPSRLDRHWTPRGYVGASVVIVAMHLLTVPWTGRKLRNTVVKRRWIRWLWVSGAIYAGATVAALVGPVTSPPVLALGVATQAAYCKAMYELAGASPDDWDRSAVSQKA